MSVAPLAAGRHSIRGWRPTTQNVEEGFRFGGPGQATRAPPKDHPPRYAAHLATLHRLSSLAVPIASGRECAWPA